MAGTKNPPTLELGFCADRDCRYNHNFYRTNISLLNHTTTHRTPDPSKNLLTVEIIAYKEAEGILVEGSEYGLIYEQQSNLQPDSLGVALSYHIEDNIDSVHLEMDDTVWDLIDSLKDSTTIEIRVTSSVQETIEIKRKLAPTALIIEADLQFAGELKALVTAISACIKHEISYLEDQAG